MNPPEAGAASWHDQVRQSLDQAERIWAETGPERALLTLNARLGDLRRAAGPAWAREVVPAVRSHPITARIRQTPLVAHASTWPRGYPGDAGLIDQLYHADAASGGLEDEERRANATVRQSRVARSVRHRRLVIADAIDEACSHHPRPDILSVACGHAREVEWSLTMADGLVGRFVAADQDEDSLAEVRQRLCPRFPAVMPLQLTVRGILAGRGAALGNFHLVYAAGLYDYLAEPVARALTARLFQLLHPGGRLLIGNFSDTPVEIGFMESIMDWPLVWRSPAQLAALSSAIPASEIASQNVWPDPTGACCYLDLTRA